MRKNANKKTKKSSSSAPLKISACMMVKNESKNLHRCLSSIKDFVNEIIVVDTGSTDDSIEICKSYGAKVYEHPWEDDFSLHRNQSISYATGDWVFIVDADEELCFDNVNTHFIRKQLKKVPEGTDGGSIRFRDIKKGQEMMQFNSSRLFRNGKVKYKGSVHNQPSIQNNTATYIEGIHIKHYGYDLTEEEKAVKTKRTKDLLLRRILKDPKDHLANFYMMQLHADNQEYEESVKYGEKYIKMKEAADKEDFFMSVVYYCMVRSYIYLQNPKKAEEWLNMGIQALPEDLDLALGLVEFSSWQRRGDLLVMGINKFLTLYDRYLKDPSLMGHRFVYSLNPEARLFCLFHLSAFNSAQTVNAFNMLKEALPTANPQYANGVIADVRKFIEVTKLGRIANMFNTEPSRIITDISAFGR